MKTIRGNWSRVNQVHDRYSDGIKYGIVSVIAFGIWAFIILAVSGNIHFGW